MSALRKKCDARAMVVNKTIKHFALHTGKSVYTVKHIMNLNSQDLRKALSLAEEKESCLDRIATIEQQLAALLGGEPVKATETAKTTRRSKRPKSRRLKELIIPVLKKAGPKGLARKEISARSGISPANLNAWLNRTAKSITGFKKVGFGRYAWLEE